MLLIEPKWFLYIKISVWRDKQWISSSLPFTVQFFPQILLFLEYRNQFSFFPSLVLNNLWEGVSTTLFEGYSHLNDLTCPFFSFVSSHLFITSCSTLSDSSVCLGRISALTFDHAENEKHRRKSRPRCSWWQKCCFRKDLISSICVVPTLISFPSS